MPRLKKRRIRPIPRGYKWIATITHENEAYLVEIHGENRKITDYKAFGALRNAQAWITANHGRILWETGEGVWYGHCKVKESVPT